MPLILPFLLPILLVFTVTLGGHAMGSFDIKSGSAVMDLPPAQWAIEGLVPQGGLTQLFAPPSSAKSLVALSMALSMSVGRDCLVVRRGFD